MQPSQLFTIEQLETRQELHLWGYGSHKHFHITWFGIRWHTHWHYPGHHSLI